mgnify:CR=1 FL=1
MPSTGPAWARAHQVRVTRTTTATAVYTYLPATGDVDVLNANLVGANVLASSVQPDGKTVIAGTFTAVLGQPLLAQPVPRLLVPELELVPLPHQHHMFFELRELAQRGWQQEPAGTIHIQLLRVPHQQPLRADVFESLADLLALFALEHADERLHGAEFALRFLEQETLAARQARCVGVMAVHPDRQFT